MTSALNLPRTDRPRRRRADRKCGSLPTWLAMPAPADLETGEWSRGLHRRGNGRARFSRAVAIALVLSLPLWGGLVALLLRLV